MQKVLYYINVHIELTKLLYYYTLYVFVLFCDSFPLQGAILSIFELKLIVKLQQSVLLPLLLIIVLWTGNIQIRILWSVYGLGLTHKRTAVTQIDTIWQI